MVWLVMIWSVGGGVAGEACYYTWFCTSSVEVVNMLLV